jgi:hypothetical protein
MSSAPPSLGRAASDAAPTVSAAAAICDGVKKVEVVLRCGTYLLLNELQFPTEACSACGLDDISKHVTSVASVLCRTITNLYGGVEGATFMNALIYSPIVIRRRPRERQHPFDFPRC